MSQGTLPFIPLDLLRNPTITHRVDHDLESLFWTLLYACVKYSDEPSWAAPVLRQLEMPDLSLLMPIKSAILAYPQAPQYLLQGKFAPLQTFLTDYAELCWENYRRSEGQPRHLTPERVISFITKSRVQVMTDSKMTSSPPLLSEKDASPERE